MPKSVDHAPSRTIFLWTVHLDRLRVQITERIKKSFFNLSSRIHFEKDKSSLLIAKTDRSDVAANPELLSPSERAQLKILHASLNRLQHRIDKLFIEYVAFKKTQ